MLPSSPPKDKKDEATEWLKQAFFYGIRQVNGKHCVIRQLKKRPPWPKNEPTYLIAIGKAAESMALGATEIFSDSLLQGLVITAPAYRSKIPSPPAYPGLKAVTQFLTKKAWQQARPYCHSFILYPNRPMYYCSFPAAALL